MPLSTLSQRLAKGLQTEDAQALYKGLPISEAGPAFCLINTFFNSIWRLFLDLQPHHNVLVVDSNLGTAALAFSHSGANIYAAVPSADGLTCIKKRSADAGLNVTPFLSSELSQQPFSDLKFDYVLIFSWESYETGSKEIDKAIKDDGTFLLASEDRPSFLSVALQLAGIGFTDQNYFLSLEDSQGILYQVRKVDAGTSLFKNVAAAFREKRKISLIARKSASSPAGSLIQKIIAQTDSAGKAPFECLRISLGSYDVVRVDLGDTILRIPMSEIGLSRCKEGSAALRDLAHFKFPFEVPLYVNDGVQDGQAFFVETKIAGEGVPYLEWSDSDRARVLGHAQELLAQFYKPTQRPLVLDEANLQRLFIKPIQSISMFLDPAAVRKLEKLSESIVADLAGHEIISVRTHGDFKSTNFMSAKSGEISGLIDWDLSSKNGLPLMDIVLCFAFERMVQSGITLSQAIFNVGFHETESGKARLHPDLSRYLSGGLTWEHVALLTLISYFHNHVISSFQRNADVRHEFSTNISSACDRMFSGAEPVDARCAS